MGFVRYRNGSGDQIGWKDGDGIHPLSGDRLVDALNAGAPGQGDPVTATSVDLLPAMDPDGKILCVALNYVDHAKEAEQPVPESPILFFKSREAMISGDEAISLPDHITQLDYEGELAIIIGKGGYRIAPEDAWDHIAGVTAFNDVSARNLFKVKAGDKEHLDWFSGKCLERSTPIGPEVIPIGDVIDDLKAKRTRIRTLVNGEVRQDAVIADMIFDIPTLVAFASSRVSLSPGDVIATGTPPGVGAGTGRFISSGDVVRVEITGLPVLENRVA
ncbi:fumarylacetoacetate hydrolase family protein [Marivita hallyeonensis]|uniref:Acylpyruvate hydrolase n=1 Tax=Marivita hallyeonensis TaxID=996342 RepID=A0A1M5SCL3_9RHOB|nr:fumarylacetoacetate hydrolase family protein [Marivita hallyeonensis]SHH36215.1 acylpyruvate hydrolase [Marivita hallyeonensis]